MKVIGLACAKHFAGRETGRVLLVVCSHLSPVIGSLLVVPVSAATTNKSLGECLTVGGRGAVSEHGLGLARVTAS